MKTYTIKLVEVSAVVRDGSATPRIDIDRGPVLEPVTGVAGDVCGLRQNAKGSGVFLRSARSAFQSVIVLLGGEKGGEKVSGTVYR